MSLKQRIIDEIDSTGPMPFDRFMQISLYDPDGFFGSDVLRSSRGGDFLTSPEVSGLFGETLASFVESERDRLGQPFELIEVGAGSGSLLRPLVESIDVEARAVEVSPGARVALASTLFGVEVLTDLPGRIRGVVIANELIDNLPMAIAQRIDDEWRERWVGLMGNDLVFVDADPRDEVLDWLDEFSGEVPHRGWVEVQLEASRWITDVLERLERGAVLIIDYGDTAERLLSRRGVGTLRTYRAHHLGPHPLDEPGEIDITADVNFTALLAAARGVGGEVELHRQDDFLGELGLRRRLSELRRAELDASRLGYDVERFRLRALRTEAETLLHPRGLGDFRVLVCRK